MNALDRKVGTILGEILNRRDPRFRWYARPAAAAQAQPDGPSESSPCDEES